VSIKFPSDFSQAPYQVFASGVSALPQKITFPFSLINSPRQLYPGISPAYNEIMPAWLLLTVAGMGVAFAMRRLGVASWVPYVAIAGTLSWIGLVKASIEPALALVPIVPFLPTAIAQKVAPTGHRSVERDAEFVAEGIAGAHDSNSALELFERQLKLFVDVGLFFFAFANAGVAFGFIGKVTFIVLISLVVGKTVGVTLFSWAAVKLGFPLPTGMDLRHLAVAGLIAGLGLTVALFVAGKAFAGPPFQDPAKMGAVLSGGVALLALVAGAALKVKGSVESPNDSS
jgi:NhaA family Na+:H+ antiporter